MTPEPGSILSQIKSLEAQLTALKAQLLELSKENGGLPTHTFAALYGRLEGQAESSKEQIDAALYRFPSDLKTAN